MAVDSLGLLVKVLLVGDQELLLVVVGGHVGVVAGGEIEFGHA